jgi:ribosomal-protein-alanine N-acetyltransferase
LEAMEGSFDLWDKGKRDLGGLSVSRMSHRDLEEVFEIEKQSFPSPWSRDLFVRELNNQASKLFVAREGLEGMAQLFGYICFWIVGEEAHILNLAVHPCHRRLNTATVLLSCTLAYCRDKGVMCVFLEVRRGNRPAQSLYEKFGFVTDSIRKGYYNDTGEDALVMKLEL